MDKIPCSYANMVKIWKWQDNSEMHPLTCAKCDNVKLRTELDDAFTQIFLVCPACGYKQESIPDCCMEEKKTN